jgi:cytochrome c553
MMFATPVRLALGALLLCGAAAAAEGSAGFGSAGYDWNAVTPERAAALQLSGDPVRGKEAFRGCQGCHKPNGVGRTDGVYPRLAGQHASVIVKQVTDVRADIRINPKMDPFASDHAVSLQEVVDIAVFLEAARTNLENGKGDAAVAAGGAAAYKRLGCDTCHGTAGQGDAAKLYPVVAAQHYPYLLRQMEAVQAGRRGNSHPDMAKSMVGLSAQDLQALASHMSRLPDPREGAR